MKFLESHRQYILQVFEEAGYAKEDFHFVKRKGRIITQHRCSDATFSYFKKRTTGLNLETKSFDETEYFEVKVNNGIILQASTWDVVMRYYREWLSKYNSYFSNSPNP